ncbi:YciI family protein [Microbacterium shaanxiense]
MTQYFLTVPHDSATEPTMESMQDFDPAELAAVMAAVDEFNTALKDSGAFVFAGGLHPPSTAKTVDVSSGQTAVLDEPFVEAPSYVGGFWVIEAADADAAVEWATKASAALQCRIEVRALQEEPEAYA